MKCRRVRLVQDTCGGRSRLRPLRSIIVGAGDRGGGRGGGRRDAIGDDGGGSPTSDRTSSSSIAGCESTSAVNVAADIQSENGTLDRPHTRSLSATWEARSAVFPPIVRLSCVPSTSKEEQSGGSRRSWNVRRSFPSAAVPSSETTSSTSY